MKAQTTAVVALIAVLAIVMASASAITYSWWSDTEEAEIDISSGYLDVEVSDIYLTDGLGATPVKYDELGDVKLFIKADSNNAHQSVLEYTVKFKTTIDAQYKISIGASVTDVESAKGQTKVSVANSVTCIDDNGVENPFVWTDLLQKVDDSSAVVENVVEYKVKSMITFTDVQMYVDGKINVKNEITQLGAVDETFVDKGDSKIEGIEVLGTDGDMWNVDVQFVGVTDKSTLTTEIYNVSSSEDNSFKIVLKLDNGVTFDNATVTVTIPGVSAAGGIVAYLGDGKQPVTISTENSGIDTIVKFSTEHFSEFMYFDMVVDSVDEFVLLEQFVNDYKIYFAGKTVTLGKSLDMSGVDWTPIGGADSGMVDNKGKVIPTQFKGTFDGNGKTISNLDVDIARSNAGLFGFLNGDVKDLILSDPVVTGQAAVGAVVGKMFNTGSITNVTVTNPELNGNNYIGGIVGYAYGNITKCTVTNITATAVPNDTGNGFDNGDKVGGIVGYHTNGSIDGCIVCFNPDKGKLSAYRDVGGIVGCATKDNTASNVVNNKLEGILNIQIDQKNGWYGDKAPNANAIIGTIRNDAVTQDNNEGGEIKVTYDLNNEFMDNCIYGLDGFKAFRDSVNDGNAYVGKTVRLMVDIDLKSEEWTPIGTNTDGFKGTFDGQEHVVSNLVISGNMSNVGLFANTYNGEIKNLTVYNANVSGYLNVGVIAGNPYTSKYTDIKVTGHVKVNGFAYVGGVGGKNAYANWTNIIVDVDKSSYVNADSEEDGKAYRTYVGGVIGFMGEGGHTISNVTSNIKVIGTTCDVGGIVGIAHYGNNFNNITCTGDVEITNAAEAGDAEEIGGIAGVWHNMTGTKVTLTDCTFTGNLKANIAEGLDLSDNKYVGKAYDESGTGALIINGIVISAPSISQGEMSSSITNGGSFIVKGDVKINESIGKDLALGLNGNELEATTTIELKGNSDLSISNGDYTVNGTYGHIDVRPSSEDGSTVMFNGVNFSFNQLNKTYGPSTNRLGSILEFCATATDAKANIVFKNCTFNNASVLFEGLSGTVGEFEATFENCTFNCLTSSAPIEVQNYVKGIINIIGCTFNIEATSNSASAVSVSPSSSTSVTIVAENNTINAVAATPYTFDASKGENEAHNIKVNGTVTKVSFISSYENCTVTETGTEKTGIAV